MSYFEDVKAWDEAAQAIKEETLRINVMKEEWDELQEALEEGDIASIAKEAADVVWTVLGLMDYYSIPFDQVWEEVARSNFDKVPLDGIIRRREDGKILKLPGWTPADIKGLLKEHV